MIQDEINPALSVNHYNEFISRLKEHSFDSRGGTFFYPKFYGTEYVCIYKNIYQFHLHSYVAGHWVIAGPTFGCRVFESQRHMNKYLYDAFIRANNESHVFDRLIIRNPLGSFFKIKTEIKR